MAERSSMTTWFLVMGLIGSGIGLFWPEIETHVLSSKCPWPFNTWYDPDRVPTLTPTGKLYTIEELAQYDGSDATKPILLAVGGKVLDVTSGKQFYGKGASYNQFAGRAATRALALGTLDKKEINENTDDFTDEQKVELKKLLKMYYTKYPHVGELTSSSPSTGGEL